MKTLQTTILNYKYLLLTILCFSCSAEDGVDGTQGKQGPARTDGNANIIASRWYEPVESDFSVSSAGHKALPIYIPLYNEDTDVLLVYYYDQLGSNYAYTHIYLLPYYNENTNKSVELDIRPSFSKLYIIISSIGRNLDAREYLWEPDPANLDKKGVRFRYIIIPANTTNKTTKVASSKNTAKPFDRIKKQLSANGININNYEAVCNYYGIDY